MELPQTNANEAEQPLVAAQNPWFLHTANRPAAEQQLSPHQGMHTQLSPHQGMHTQLSPHQGIPTFFICFPFLQILILYTTHMFFR